jgi:predicted lipoprotein
LIPLRAASNGFALILALTGAAGDRSCAPWTIRRIGDDSQSQSQHLTPAAYAASVWSSQLLPAMLKSAADARTLLDAMRDSVDAAGQKYGHREGPGAWYFVVRGSGAVLSVNSASRVRTIDVDIAPFDGKPDLSIEIGPVLRGTAIRDATGLVLFSNFTSQLEYADVGNALNEIVLKSVLAPVASPLVEGRHVAFVGAFSASSGWQPPVRDVIPAQLSVEESSQ